MFQVEGAWSILQLSEDYSHSSSKCLVFGEQDSKQIEISKIILESWFQSLAHSNDTKFRIMVMNEVSLTFFCLKILIREVSRLCPLL